MNPMILRNLSYGMYAIGVKGKERPSACIVNTVVRNYVGKSANYCSQYESL